MRWINRYAGEHRIVGFTHECSDTSTFGMMFVGPQFTIGASFPWNDRLILSVGSPLEKPNMTLMADNSRRWAFAIFSLRYFVADRNEELSP